MTRRSASLVPSLILAAAMGALVARGISRVDDGASPARLHSEEAQGKQARFLAQQIKRASMGALPPSVEGRDRGFDVLTYDLWFGLDPAVVHLDGVATIRIVAHRETASIELDLDDAFSVLEAGRDGKPLEVSRRPGKLVVPLAPPLHPEERTTLRIAYGGTPPSYGALDFWQHATGYAATSVAEPFDAPTFWPCVDDPLDRAVTTVRATVPAGYVVASAGLATRTDEPDGRVTFTWRLAEPISTYLVSLNVANYVPIDDRYLALDGVTQMPIRSYVLPQSEAHNVSRLADIKGHIATLASLFGEYPFLSTKYGIVESSFSGGMEHPTMTSIGTGQLASTQPLTTLLVHELAHQWWGDRVTMRTWDDVWLNEGFATYAEVLYYERTAGTPPGALLSARYDDGLYSGRLGPAVVASPGDPFRYTGAIYSKGAWVLHMLRRLVGDPAFFEALRAYGDRHALGTASRADLRRDFEERTGRDLKQFFDQWVETPYRPVLRATWQVAPDLASVTVTLRQVQGHGVVHPEAAAADRPFYVFPLTVALTLEGATIVQGVEVSSDTQVFEIPNPTRKPVMGLFLDPDGDLLKVVESAVPPTLPLPPLAPR